MQRMERLALAGKYAAEIAHEIKNPLAAVSGSMQMLRTEMPSDSALGRLSGIVCREIDRINALVTDFLWLARKPSRVEKLQALSVSATVLDTLSLMHEHQEISARYQVRTVFSGDPVICVDPHVFQQILWNLLRNALEAMPQGGGIVIRAGLDDSPAGSAPGQPRRVTVEVEDSGEGIPAELLDKVFEPFFTTKEKGTGLGLSTVYQLVQSSGGNIGVSSVPPHGTTFSVSFPAAATPLAATA
jgi:two-component system sensor histidine kinase PilS (NtrC family)